jgi:ComF family protein
MRAHTLLHTLLDVLFPPSARALRVRSLSAGHLPVSFETHSPLGEEISSCMPYADSRVRDLIWMLKYRRLPAAAALCADALADVVGEMIADERAFSDKTILLIPVPLSKKRLRERGFNQVEDILHILPERLPDTSRVSIGTDIVVRARHVPPQTSLARSERLKNVRGVFSVQNEAMLKKTRVFLFDDVTTTGATLTEAARTLKKSGALVTCIALARA